MAHILLVIARFLRTPQEWSTADRHLHAAKLVAEERGVTVQTIMDQCGRSLYGQGQLAYRFRGALEKIEADYRRSTAS